MRGLVFIDRDRRTPSGAPRRGWSRGRDPPGARHRRARPGGGRCAPRAERATDRRLERWTRRWRRRSRPTGKVDRPRPGSAGAPRVPPGAGDDPQTGRVGLCARVPAPARHQDEHPGRSLWPVAPCPGARPGSPGGPDEEPLGGPVVGTHPRVPRDRRSVSMGRWFTRTSSSRFGTPRAAAASTRASSRNGPTLPSASAGPLKRNTTRPRERDGAPPTDTPCAPGAPSLRLEHPQT
jgi:hypothetical protein